MITDTLHQFGVLPIFIQAASLLRPSTENPDFTQLFVICADLLQSRQSVRATKRVNENITFFGHLLMYLSHDYGFGSLNSKHQLWFHALKSLQWSFMQGVWMDGPANTQFTKLSHLLLSNSPIVVRVATYIVEHEIIPNLAQFCPPVRSTPRVQNQKQFLQDIELVAQTPEAMSHFSRALVSAFERCSQVQQSQAQVEHGNADGSQVRCCDLDLCVRLARAVKSVTAALIAGGHVLAVPFSDILSLAPRHSLALYPLTAPSSSPFPLPSPSAASSPILRTNAECVLMLWQCVTNVVATFDTDMGMVSGTDITPRTELRHHLLSHSPDPIGNGNRKAEQVSPHVGNLMVALLAGLRATRVIKQECSAILLSLVGDPDINVALLQLWSKHANKCERSPPQPIDSERNNNVHIISDEENDTNFLAVVCDMFRSTYFEVRNMLGHFLLELCRAAPSSPSTSNSNPSSSLSDTLSPISSNGNGSLFSPTNSDGSTITLVEDDDDTENITIQCTTTTSEPFKRGLGMKLGVEDGIEIDHHQTGGVDMRVPSREELVAFLCTPPRSVLSSFVDLLGAVDVDAIHCALSFLELVLETPTLPTSRHTPNPTPVARNCRNVKPNPFSRNSKTFCFSNRSNNNNTSSSSPIDGDNERPVKSYAKMSEESGVINALEQVAASSENSDLAAHAQRLNDTYFFDDSNL